MGGGSLPAWADGPPRAPRRRLPLRVPTGRLVLGIVFIGALFAAYVGHSAATDRLLTYTENLRRENLRLHLQADRLRGELDQRASPEVVLRRAAALGLVEDAAYGPTLQIAD